MTKKEQLLAWELENKRLDVEIKEEQLHQERLKSGDLRKQIETQALLRYEKDLANTVGYQHGQIQRLRSYLRDAEARNTSLAGEVARATVIEKELNDLKNTPVIKLFERIRKWFNPVKYRGFLPMKFLRAPTSVSGSLYNSMSPEVRAMSADEFKKKYIDTAAL